MMNGKSIVWLVAIFLLGAVAGFGIGNVYGSNSYNAQLEQKVIDLQNRFQTANENYLTLAREYNKLFALRGSSVVESTMTTTPASTAPASTAPASTSSAAPKATVAPTTAAKPTATSAAKAPASSSAAPAAGAKAKPEFKAEAIGGTGPLEGAPPLLVRFTDLSTGTITSWKWDFGDGESSTEKNPEHLYRDCPGEKKLCTVKLTVCGPDGCVTATKPDYLWVSESCTGC